MVGFCEIDWLAQSGKCLGGINRSFVLRNIPCYQFSLLITRLVPDPKQHSTCLRIASRYIPSPFSQARPWGMTGCSGWCSDDANGPELDVGHPCHSMHGPPFAEI